MEASKFKVGQEVLWNGCDGLPMRCTVVEWNPDERAYTIRFPYGYERPCTANTLDPVPAVSAIASDKTTMETEFKVGQKVYWHVYSGSKLEVTITDVLQRNGPFAGPAIYTIRLPDGIKGECYASALSACEEAQQEPAKPTKPIETIGSVWTEFGSKEGPMGLYVNAVNGNVWLSGHIFTRENALKLADLLHQAALVARVGDLVRSANASE